MRVLDIFMLRVSLSRLLSRIVGRLFVFSARLRLSIRLLNLLTIIRILLFRRLCQEGTARN